NLLVYGNNGSGKSSLFWALYTLLQSSTKTDQDIQKYFVNYLVSDKSTHQTLKNIFMNEAENSYIEITSIDEESDRETTYTISYETEVLNVKKVVIKIAQNILKFGQPISKY
ncbi:AAA family ATPase, partial [Cylindrospermopsis raciborskii CS-506_B]